MRFGIGMQITKNTRDYCLMLLIDIICNYSRLLYPLKYSIYHQMLNEFHFTIF